MITSLTLKLIDFILFYLEWTPLSGECARECKTKIARMKENERIAWVDDSDVNEFYAVIYFYCVNKAKREISHFFANQGFLSR